MKVAIDATPLETGHKKRGIGIYTKNLIETLRKVDKDNEYILFTRGQELPEVDLIHYPYFDLFFLTLPLFKKYPTVVTIYDVIPLIFWREFNPGFRAALKFQIQKFSLKNVARIITISQCSKKDIQKYLSVPADKIDVTYLAADSIFKPIDNKEKLEETRKKYNLPQKFILYVGDVNYNKNLPRLFEAMAQVSVSLVIVGEAAKNEKLPEVRVLMKLAKKLSIEKQILRLGFVSDSDLVTIYNLAACYIQPSLYEGFGLPVLEAMACGTPVVCSNISSLPEIAGETAVYVDPESAESVASGIEKILRCPRADYETIDYETMKKKFQEHAKKFSWEKTARDTIKVYEKTIGD
jgi:glycosyltransferase involved in cell wall biosynthesis